MTVSNLDAREFLWKIPDETVMLAWTDPPFGTGKEQRLHSTTRDRPYFYQDGDSSESLELVISTVQEIERVLHPQGTLALLLDYRIIHESVVEIRRTTGLKFKGEIIYHFELGGVSRKWWTNKHNTIALFTKDDPKFYLDRVPLTLRKAGRGDYQSEERRVNSVWSYTMGPSSHERTGYPNQKPVDIVTPFVKVHTDEGDLCIDPFCGSGVVGVAAVRYNRRYLLNDLNSDAVRIASERLGLLQPTGNAVE